MRGGYGRRTIALVVTCDTRAGSSGGVMRVITPLFDFDNRSVTQTQGISPVILQYKTSTTPTCGCGS